MKFEYIKRKLIELRSEVEIDNDKGHFDINKIVEDVYMHILNDVYGWKLKNANLIQENFPAIDLVDDDKMVVIQVTSTTTATKLKNTIKKFKKLDEKYKYYSLKMFYIKNKPDFKKTSLEKFKKEGIEKSDLLGITDILDEVSANVNVCDRLNKTLHKMFNENIVRYKYHSKCKNLTSLPYINTNFVGRKANLKDIKKNLDSNNVVCVINGIGGIGKSELAYKYYHEYKDEYKKIAFIKITEDDSSLENVFHRELQDSLYLKSDDNFTTILRRLQGIPPKNLLLVDNILSNDDLKKIKSLNINFDILVTTRAKLDSKNILNLEILNNQDAKELFLSIYNTNENIDAILKYLDNHPLFINLTAYSLKEEYIDLTELKESIDSGKVIDIDSKDEKTFQEHLQKTFNKQFQDEKNEDLKTLLRTLAIFPAIEINFELLNKILNDKKLKVKLQKLVKRGWLSKKENSYKLHQIIKTFILEEHPIEYREITYILETIGTYINHNDSNLIDYITIIESLLKLFENKEDKYIAWILDSNTYLYYSLGDYDKSLEMQKKSLIIRKSLYDDNHIEIAINYNNLASLYNSKGEYDKAELLHEKALKIRVEILGEYHSDTATSYNNLAGLYDLKGEYNKAESLYEKALKIREKILGENHPDTATSYSNLALLYNSKGEYNRAEILYKKALKIREKILGENHPDTATSYNNLAGLYYSKGKYNKAETLFKKILQIRVKILGEKHPDTATSYNNLALLYKSKGEYNRAEPFFEKALKINKEALREKHPDTAISYNNLALLYASKDEYKKAEPFYKKALKINKEVWGEKHSNTATSYNNLAFLYKLKGEHEKAEPLFEKALKISKEVLGENHPDTAESYWNLGLFYRDRKLYFKAKELFEKCIDIVEELDYFEISLVRIKLELKKMNDNLKKEKRTKHNKKG